MSEYSIKDILVNWKYQRGVYADNEICWGNFHKLNENLEELEKLIVDRLSQGGVLSEYAKVCKELNHPIGSKTYAEIRRLYELCKGRRYFDVSEIDEVMHMDYKEEFTQEKFAEIMMDIIVRCPASVDKTNILYHAQRYLFKLGSENEVWFAYRNGLYPKAVLGELLEAMKKENFSKIRLAWIVAWMSV